MYESFLHRLNMFMTCMESAGIQELLANADRFSYAHRVGNGELSEAEQEAVIDSAFWKLCDTPETDKLVTERQKKYSSIHDS